MQSSSRFVLVAIALLLAACQAPDPNRLKPLTDADGRRPIKVGAKFEAPDDMGIVVMGISIRNPRGDKVFGITTPAWIGWIQFDPATGRRVGKQMIVAAEDCKGWYGANPTTACESVQYRAFVVEPGNYALAWSYHAFGYYPYARFRKTQLEYHPINGTLQNGLRFSDDAFVRKGGAAFSVGAGEVVYVGDFTFDYAGTGGIASAAPGDVEAARKYVERMGRFVEAMGLANKLINHPGTIITIDPTPPDQEAEGTP